MPPPYAVGQSMCLLQSDFRSVDLYPVRSPLIVADFLRPLVMGKTYVEIGTQSGDVCACLKDSAARVIAVERDLTKCKRMQKRGIEVVCKQVDKLNFNETIPTGDVFYWWMPAGMNMVFLRFVDKAMRLRGATATAYFPIDTHMPNDLAQLPGQLKELKSAAYEHSGAVTRLFFDEQGGEGLYANKTLGIGSEASYSTPYMGRPGRWGVMHMLSVRVGRRSEHGGRASQGLAAQPRAHTNRERSSLQRAAGGASSSTPAETPTEKLFSGLRADYWAGLQKERYNQDEHLGWRYTAAELARRAAAPPAPKRQK